MRRRLFVTGVVLGLLLGVTLVVLPLDPGGEPWREEASAADYRALGQLAGRVTRTQLEGSLAILDPAGILDPYLTLTDRAVQIRGAPDDAEPLVEVALAEAARAPERPATLDGMRILVDPGHFGGVWSEIESRHVQLDGREPVREGDLNWATARLLQEKLEQAGVQVVLTRGPPASAPFPERLDPAFDAEHEAALVLAERIGESPLHGWYRLYPSLLGGYMLRRARNQIVEEELLELYKRFDLRRRAAMATEVEADLTLSLHYNTTGPRNRNWIIVFVPGNALPGELDTLSQRYWTIRRALEGELGSMRYLAGRIGRAMHEHLDVGFVDGERALLKPLPKKIPLSAKRGVWARNLAILRRTPGLVVLVEGPCVDNTIEYELLQDRSVWVDGRAYPARAQKYSNAVLEALEDWTRE